MRAIWENYAGLVPPPLDDRALRRTGFGRRARRGGCRGRAALVAAARARLDAGEPVAALHLTDLVLAADPGDADARTVAAAANRRLLDGSDNFWERAWLNRTIHHLEEG